MHLVRQELIEKKMFILHMFWIQIILYIVRVCAIGNQNIRTVNMLKNILISYIHKVNVNCDCVCDTLLFHFFFSFVYIVRYLLSQHFLREQGISVNLWPHVQD